jgi:DnaK suppressor protein
MDQTRARALLAAERVQLKRLLQAAAGEPQAVDVGDEVDDADRRNAEETGTAVDQLLQARWAALERAEARLAAGSYGRSVHSGRPIPDERLEADPLAELTVEEAAAAERGTLEGATTRSGWRRPVIPSRCSPTPISPRRRSRPARRTTTRSLPSSRAWASTSSATTGPGSPATEVPSTAPTTKPNPPPGAMPCQWLPGRASPGRAATTFAQPASRKASRSALNWPCGWRTDRAGAGIHLQGGVPDQLDGSPGPKRRWA